MQHDPEPADGDRGRPAAADLHLLPPGARARGAGGADPAHALRAHRRRDRPRLRRLRGGDGEAARAGAAKIDATPASRTACRRRDALPERLDRRARGALPALHRGLRAAAGATTSCGRSSRGGDPPHPARRGAAAGEPEVLGLLALELLQDARRPARTGADGVLVPLDEQDRSRWDSGRIARGQPSCSPRSSRQRTGPYTLQARIAVRARPRAAPTRRHRPGSDRGALRTPGAAHALAVRRAGAGGRGEPRRGPGCGPRPARAARARPAARLPARGHARRPAPPGRASRGGAGGLRRGARRGVELGRARVPRAPPRRGRLKAAPAAGPEPRAERSTSTSAGPSSVRQDKIGRSRPAEPISSC